MLLFANNADSTLKVGALAADVQLYLADGTGARFPQPANGDTFFLTLIDGLGNTEIVEVTARVGDVLTVTRARDGTAARSFAQGAVVDHRITAEVLRRMSPASLRGAPNGLAPLDADSRLPEIHLPVSLMTQTAADARYARLTLANGPNGYPQLDNNAKILVANLPGDVVLHTEANATFIPLTQRGAANGVATLDVNGKIPVAMINPAAIDLSPYATKNAAAFTGGASVSGGLTADTLNVPGQSVLGALQIDTINTIGVVTIMGGAARGKLTLSTSPPSGSPANGDEWVQHEV